MAGRGRGIVAAGLCLWATGALGDPASPAATPVLQGFPELETMRKNFESLSPEQKQKFRENFQKWMSLPPEEKKLLREREELRRLRVSEEIEKALKDSGLNLTPEQKEQYTKRYSEERRHIEEKLQEQRKPMVRDMVSRLRDEFGGSAAK